jgi:hypothetical protein
VTGEFAPLPFGGLFADTVPEVGGGGVITGGFQMDGPAGQLLMLRYGVECHWWSSFPKTDCQVKIVTNIGVFRERLCDILGSDRHEHPE